MPATVRISSPIQRALPAVWLALLLLLSPGVDAGDDLYPHFSLRGFGTLGLARSSSTEAEFVRDLSQPDGTSGGWEGNLDSMLGLQGNAHFSEQLEGVIQAVSRYRHDGSFDPELAWAFLNFMPVNNVSLRGGRLGTEFYMLADSRLVGYSLLTVRPPGDYFGSLPFYSIDGVDAQFTVPAFDGLLRGKVFTGVSPETLGFGDRNWDLRGSRMTGAHLDYLTGAWQWRLGYSQLRMTHDLPLDDLYGLLSANGFQSLRESMAVSGTYGRYLSFGAVYDQGPWQVHLMLSRTRQESLSFEDSRAGYLLAGYRSGDFTPYAGYSWWKSSPRQVTAMPPGVLGAKVAWALSLAHSDQHTLFLGMRWDVRPNLAIKGQWDHIQGKASSIFPYRGELPGWDGNTDVLSLTLDFLF